MSGIWRQLISARFRSYVDQNVGEQDGSLLKGAFKNFAGQCVISRSADRSNAQGDLLRMIHLAGKETERVVRNIEFFEKG